MYINREERAKWREMALQNSGSDFVYALKDDLLRLLLLHFLDVMDSLDSLDALYREDFVKHMMGASAKGEEDHA